MNINTMAYLLGGGTLAPAQQRTIPPLVLASAAAGVITPFTTSPNALTGLGGGSAVLSVPSNFWSPYNPAGTVSLYNSGRPFHVHVHGTYTTDVTANISISLYQIPASILAANTQATLANDQVVDAGSAKAAGTNGSSGSWFADYDLRFEGTLLTLSGIVTSQLKNNTIVSPVAVSGALILTAEADLNFMPAVLVSAITAKATITVDEFSISQTE